ncbi:MAG TPA: hypothetical protein EYH42_01125 [Sulfurovum sp.]|nr:hypothetical protein [Sulfurovum sp.]
MIRAVFLLFVVFGIGAVGFYSYEGQRDLNKVLNDDISVLLVYGNGQKESIGIRAFSSVLEEEGVSYEVISNVKLLAVAPEKILPAKPAIIFPDHASDYLLADTKIWVEKYIKEGGKVCVAADAGSKNRAGLYLLQKGIFDDLLGIQDTEDNIATFMQGPLTFKGQNEADYFGIPKGKYDKEGHLVGYKYGVLTYPYRKISIKNSVHTTIYAWSDSQSKVPLIVKKDISKGSILFVNLSLGNLKGESDDLLLRSVIKTFLFKMVHVPHIVSSPHAKGGLVINFHIDSNEEHLTFPWFIEEQYLNEQLKYSIHITAGPDCYKMKDNMGFSATKKGKDIVKQLMQFGEIGSHGGWAHNWFSNGIQKGFLDEKKIKHYIELNNKALENITKYKIKEYSAPDGMFPQPISIKILEELGMESYYYTGDSGSAPNRSFYKGEQLSENIIGFPVMTFGKKASIHEFAKENIAEEEVEKALKGIVDYVIENRTVRLYYTHPYDIYRSQYQQAFKHFIDYAVVKQDKALLVVESMQFFREYLLRLINVNKKFTWENDKMDIMLSSEEELDAMVVAIPKYYAGKKVKVSQEIDQDEIYYYMPVESNNTQFTMELVYERCYTKPR